MAELPLFLGLVILSIGASSVSVYITGHDVYKPLIQHMGSSMSALAVALPIAVLVEEAVFRSILRVTPNRLRNIGSLLLWIPLGYHYHAIKEMTNEYALLWLVPVWLLVAYGLGMYLKRPTVFARIETFWRTNFNWIFYAIGLLYAFLKIADDVSYLKDWQLLLLPVTVLSSVWSSFYFGYVRMVYGFWYAVAVHILLLVALLTPEVICLL